MQKWFQFDNHLHKKKILLTFRQHVFIPDVFGAGKDSVSARLLRGEC